MKNWQLIKKNVSKEIESTVNTIDPAFDINNCLDLYSKVLMYKVSIPTKNDLDGLEKMIDEALNENFVNYKLNSISIGLFCKNFEQFVKKIYYVLQENEFIDSENLLDSNSLQALGPFLSTLNKVRPIYKDKEGMDVYEEELAKIVDGEPNCKINSSNGSKMYQKLYPGKLRFDKYNDVNDTNLNNDYENEFVLYLIKAVILKNEQSHQAPDRNRSEIINNLNSTLIAELWIINFFKKELASAIKKDNFRKKDFDQYINSEIEKLKRRSLKFVSLNLKELTNQSTGERVGFIEDLLNEDLNRIRILGQGGSGKTTTLEYLLYKDAKSWIENSSNSKIPVLISLANLPSNRTIIDGISKKINVDKDYVEELLKTNEIKIYLDGVNEMVKDRESKKLKLQEIDFLIENYPKLNIVITDRYEFDSYQNNMFNVPTFLIQKLTSNQIHEFVKKYCDNSLDLSEHVMEILRSKTNIQELLLRPLVLTRAIEIIKADNALPDKEGQIIEKFIDLLLKREKDEKKDPLLNIVSFKLVLAYAANEIWSNHKSNAPVHQFKFNKMIVDAAEKYGLEKYNAGYIIRIGYELEILSKNEELIQFYHQSYIEFLCNYFLNYEIR